MKNRKTRVLCRIVLSLAILFSSQALAAEGGIKDAESATHGTDAAQYTVVDTYQFPGFKVIQFELPVLSIYSYLLVSGSEALVVDPGRDASYIIQAAKDDNAVIKGVYVSHSHADFVAGHLEVSTAMGCPVYQSNKSGAEYPFTPLDETSSLAIGSATIRFLDTPGHTPDGMCALVYSQAKPAEPELLFTGDVLFVGSVGRPDLMGGTVSAAWLASAMFDSWNSKLSKLGEAVKVFPAHGAGSLCGAHLSDEPFSTIGKEKASNPYLKHTARGEFVAALLEGLPEAPQYFKHNARMNKQGPPLIDWNAPLPSELTPAMAITDPAARFVVDLRTAKDYSQGHIPNSVNIGLRGRLETWVGIMVPWEANLVLAGNADELKEAVHRLHRVGYKAEIITLDSWEKAGLPLKTTPSIAPAALYAQMQDGTAPVIVDVRLPSEWMGLRIGTVLNMPLNHLEALSAQLNPEDPVVAVCNSAYRSNLAVGILERKGFQHPTSLDGGSEAWIKASLPVFESAKAGAAAASAPKKYVRLPERISADALNRMMMDLPETFDLVDIRPPEHFADFSLPGARNIDIGELLSNTAHLVGLTPLVIVDRDGSLAMAAGGILSQKTERPIKVLFGGLEGYWEGQSGAQRAPTPLPSPGAVQQDKGAAPPVAAPESAPAPAAPKRKSAGC